MYTARHPSWGMVTPFAVGGGKHSCCASVQVTQRLETVDEEVRKR